jgi:sugar lactone lactonase YvrE
MRRATTPRAVSLVIAVVLISSPLTASAAVGDRTADGVVGQPDVSSGLPDFEGISARSLSGPTGVAFDASGNLFVADYGNNRVLGYLSPLTTDRVADLVIGQPDFTSARANGGVSASSVFGPFGLAVSATGDLYVADSGNNRVLEYDRPFATDTVADRVIGQPDFVSNGKNSGGIGAASLDRPTGVAIDAAGDLWVADNLNHRVFEYDRPSASDAVADLVLGQPSFETGRANYEGISARTLHFPFGVGVDARGNVWVADTLNNRVLEYDDPKHADTAADRVLGQPSFTSNTENSTGAVDAAGVRLPIALSIDAQGDVLVCDVANNRLLAYRSPLARGDRDADVVFGQPDFRSAIANNGGISAESLSSPFAVATDPAGNLAIADADNSRALLFETPTPRVTSIQIKRSPSGVRRLVVGGFGMSAGDAVVEVDGHALESIRYRDVAADGSARRLVATDPNFDALIPRGVVVHIAVFNPTTGSRSVPISFTRR